jgi:hypothetical protein
MAINFKDARQKLAHLPRIQQIPFDLIGIEDRFISVTRASDNKATQSKVCDELSKFDVRKLKKFNRIALKFG